MHVQKRSWRFCVHSVYVLCSGVQKSVLNEKQVKLLYHCWGCWKKTRPSNNLNFCFQNTREWEWQFSFSQRSQKNHTHTKKKIMDYFLESTIKLKTKLKLHWIIEEKGYLHWLRFHLKNVLFSFQGFLLIEAFVTFLGAFQRSAKKLVLHFFPPEMFYGNLKKNGLKHCNSIWSFQHQKQFLAGPNLFLKFLASKENFLSR